MRQQINLIDARLLAAPVRPSLGALAALVAAAALAVAAHFSWERAQYQKLLARSAAASAEPPAQEVAPDPAHEARRRQVERDELLLAGLQRATDLPVHSAALLGQLAAALPDSLWLREVEFVGRRGLRISGGTLDVAALALYANRLGETAALAGVPIQVLAIEPRTADAADVIGADPVTAPASLPAHHHFVLASAAALVPSGEAR